MAVLVLKTSPWGMLFGILFFVPFFGLAVGAAIGALAGHFSDYGIDDDFERARGQPWGRREGVLVVYGRNTPTASWLAWRYHYPQAAFPCERLRDEAAHRGRHDPEFELGDTGVFDDQRYWEVVVEYAKASPFDLCICIKRVPA